MQPVLGIDYGLRRCGLSISSATGSFALPFKTVKTEELIKAIQESSKEDGVQILVLGHPLSLNGQENPMSLKVLELAKELSSKGFQVYLVDERHSTNQALSLLAQAGYDGKKQKKGKDETAACLILEEHLAGRSLIFENC